MKTTKNTRGQIRVIETILASLVILFALAFVNIFAVTPTSPRYETDELEKLGYNVLHNLDEHRLLGRFVHSEEWDNLYAVLRVSLPLDVYFNMTVHDLDGNIINNAPIRYGDPEAFTTSSLVASVTHLIVGYQAEYDPKILILQLVRG